MVRAAWNNYKGRNNRDLRLLDLDKVAALIEADFPTRLYYVPLRGSLFDTHVNQAAPHDRQLKYCSDAINGFFQEMKLVRVNLPPYKEGCDADAAKVACDYPPYDLNKIASAKFANSGSPAAELAKKFQWTNDDQNAVARSIAVDKLSDEAAAKKWVDANADKVKAWLPAGVS